MTASALSVPAGRPRLRPRTLALPLLCAAIALAAIDPPDRAVAPPGTGFERLPVTAQGPVSAAIGRATPAYRVAGGTARNPAQGFSARFSPAGVTVRTGRVRLGIALSAFGYGEGRRPVAPVSPDASANRVTYARGPVTEWWANGPLGLEQGFDVARRPWAASGPLRISVAVTGGLAARMERGSVLLAGRGASLRYGGLVANDAHGRLLPARLSLEPGGIALSVDDRGAAYPLRIDPVLRQSASLVASPTARLDEVGWSVAISGDTIVAGAPFRGGHGAALVFVKPRSGWSGLRTQAATLTAPGTIRFGWSVAISGPTVAVGAPGPFEEPGVHPPGDAYVFVRPRSGWAGKRGPAARLAPTTLTAGDTLGDSVSVAGNTVVVGAPGHDVAGRENQGVAYVFTRPGGGWSGTRRQAATLVGSDGHRFDISGTSVAIAGDTVAVSARQHRVSKLRLGQAYVFTRPRSGWAGTRHETATLRSERRIGGFGVSVAGSGTTIVVGSGQVDNLGPFGEAWVFERPGGGWRDTRNATARLVTPNRATDTTCGLKGESGAPQGYGHSIAISGGTVVVSAAPYGGSGPDFKGKACVFTRPASGWSGTITRATTLTPSSGRPRDLFASAGTTQLAVAGHTVVAAAPLETYKGHKGAGKAYVYDLAAPRP
jgi:FG-GAP repeat